MIPNFFILGYDGLDFDEFFRIIKKNEITLLIDIRANDDGIQPPYRLNAIEGNLLKYGSIYGHTVKFEWYKVLANFFVDRDGWEFLYQAYLVGMDREFEDLYDTIMANRVCFIYCTKDPFDSPLYILAENMRKKHGLNYADLNLAERLVERYSANGKDA